MSRLKVDLWVEHIRKNVVDVDRFFGHDFDFEDISPSDESSMELAVSRSDARDVAEFIFNLFAALYDAQIELIRVEYDRPLVDGKGNPIVVGSWVEYKGQDVRIVELDGPNNLALVDKPGAVKDRWVSCLHLKLVDEPGVVS